MAYMVVTLEVSQPEMSALKFVKRRKSSRMSVMAETHQSAMGPYFAMAEAAFELNSVTAVFREALLVKVSTMQAGVGSGGEVEGGGGEGEGGGGEGDGGGGEGEGGGGEGEGGGGLGEGGEGDGGGGVGDGGGGEGDGGGGEDGPLMQLPGAQPEP